MAVVRSHYESLDLELVGQGLSSFKTLEELDAIWVEVAPYAEGLTDCIDPKEVISRGAELGD